MNGTPAVKARRNLAQTEHRQMWRQAHSEDHPLRYRLHCKDGAYNIRGDKITLLAEIRESKPFRIERLQEQSKVQQVASLPGHQYLIGNIELVEVEA